jgi:hypothetical protein
MASRCEQISTANASVTSQNPKLERQQDSRSLVVSPGRVGVVALRTRCLWGAFDAGGDQGTKELSPHACNSIELGQSSSRKHHPGRSNTKQRRGHEGFPRVHNVCHQCRLGGSQEAALGGPTYRSMLDDEMNWPTRCVSNNLATALKRG